MSNKTVRILLKAVAALAITAASGLGFAGVKVSGAGATRRVEGVWSGKDTSANMPPQIVAVAKL